MPKPDPNTCIVHAWLAGVYVPAGKLRMREHLAEFWYGDRFLERGYALDPLRLPLTRKVFRSAGLQGDLGVFGDALPDSWGRYLIKRRYGHALSDLEILLLDKSLQRMGALRFTPALDQPPAPDSHDHDWMVHFAAWLEDNSRSLPDHIEAGSSAGGAKPKCLVNFQQIEWIAKFRAAADVVDKPYVEHGTLRLAEACGIPVPESRVITLPSGRHALLVKRFDREGEDCLHYLSGKTLCGVISNEQGRIANENRSYLVLADALSRLSTFPKADKRDLFRRAVFNILVNNHDDHAKNHGVIRSTNGEWRLSKAFDLVAGEGDRRDLAMAVGPQGNRASLSNLLQSCASFGLKKSEGSDEMLAMMTTLASWRDRFARAGVPEPVINDIAWAIQDTIDVPRE